MARSFCRKCNKRFAAYENGLCSQCRAAALRRPFKKLLYYILCGLEFIFDIFFPQPDNEQTSTESFLFPLCPATRQAA